ncbi:phage holin family protein [Hephaestia sp. GCM10023244]|uniref:phage holin family protein n=1 Tax=unclassified Hephaestia TaxID=2631281 RepID=UPI002076F9B5|nr:phage holin family protein [Hephaestia sp. MAHUQ-44]MCM8730004.1 phage holin family protein [Hephaestia sp. MAHUQ-44]
MVEGGEAHEPATTETPPGDESLRTLFRRLIVDARNFLRAEVERRRAQVLRRAVESRYAVIIAASSLLLAQAAVIALMVGLLFVLAARVGFGWATVIVTLGGLIVAGIMARVALTLLRRAISRDDDD